MVRKKNVPPGIKATRNAKKELQKQQERARPEPPEPRTPSRSRPNSPVPVSPEPSNTLYPRNIPYNELLNRQEESAKAQELASVKADMGSFQAKLREFWKDRGYYTDHPNNNPALSEADLKSKLQEHHELGPVLKEYKLYINSQPKIRTMLIQYPNAQEVYRASNGQKPVEIRIKPKCGLVEIDIPLNVHSDHYDKEKGVQYGQALRNSRLLQQGGSYGLAGGLGVGSKTTKEDRQAAAPEGPSVEKLLENFDDANNKGYVMDKITLGGQIVPYQDGDPIYMVATFSGDICTWTRLDAKVQVRPQFGHLDALHEQEKSSSRQERGHEERSDNKAEENEAKAVNMAVKSTENNEDLDMYGGMGATAKLLKAMRDEPWQRLTWVDQDVSLDTIATLDGGPGAKTDQEEESYEVYNEHLVYQDPENAPQLVSEMTEAQYLDAISCPRIDPTKIDSKGKAGPEKSGTDVESSVDGLEDLSLDDTTEEEVQGSMPHGVTRPKDSKIRTYIEMCCRLICSKPVKQQAKLVSLMTQKYKDSLDHSWVLPRDKHHAFFKWRLAENKAGRGYPPEEDMARLAAKG